MKTLAIRYDFDFKFSGFRVFDLGFRALGFRVLGFRVLESKKLKPCAGILSMSKEMRD